MISGMTFCEFNQVNKGYTLNRHSLTLFIYLLSHRNDFLNKILLFDGILFFFVLPKVLLSTPTTTLLSPMMTGKEFRWQEEVSSAMTQTKLADLESASTLFTTQQVKFEQRADDMW